MFLSNTQLVLVIALVGAVNCAKWPRPPKYPWSSEESISRSFSSEEYVGAPVPPLQLGGVPLPTPVHANGAVLPTYTHRPNPLTTPHFAELIKANTVLIDDSVGPNRKLSYISKAKPIPMPDGVGEMYYVKGYFTNEYGYRNKCTFFLYTKESHAQVLEPRCH